MSAPPARSRWPVACLTLLAVALLLVCGGRARADEAKTPEKTAPAGYRVQPGDEISVSVLPRVEFSSVETLTPDGILHLKTGATLKAIGLTVDEITVAATRALERILKRPQVSVSVTKLGQTPRVTVSGAVAKPGPVDLEPGMRFRKAIDLAGGILKEADPKRVTLTHRDLSRAVLDVSTDPSAADPRLDPLLQDGDSIDVPLQKKIKVTVVGAVGKPGPVEDVDEGSRVLKAIDMAGGALKEGDLSRVTITHADLTRTVVDLSPQGRGVQSALDAAHNLVVRDGDSVEVPLLYQTGFVLVTGEVNKPGSYEVLPGMSLEVAIETAGKLTLVADYRRIEVLRRGSPKQVVDLQQRLKEGGSKVELQPGDQVFVPRFQNQVTVVGVIAAPGPRALLPGQTLTQFLTQGAPETLPAFDDAHVDLKHVQLVRAGQPTQVVNLRALLKGDRKKEDPPLKSGDLIFLPARSEPNHTALDALRILPFIGSFISYLPL